VEQEVDRIIDSQDNVYVLSKPKSVFPSVLPPFRLLSAGGGHDHRLPGQHISAVQAQTPPPPTPICSIYFFTRR